MNHRSIFVVVCFLALAAVTAFVTGRIAEPAMPGLLIAAAVAATLAGGVGVVRRGAWPLSLFLLPLGAYLLARLQIPLPEDAGDVPTHVAFYAARIADGSSLYARQTFPLDVASGDLRLLLSLVVYAVTGLAAFFVLGLRRPLPAIVLLLCLAGFGFTTDGLERASWTAVAFLVLAGGLFALLHPLPRERLRVVEAVAGGTTAIVAAVLALSILGVTTVEAGRPLRDWRSWDLVGPGNALMRFDWMQNYPRLLRRHGDAVVMEVRSPVASYWRANVLSDFTGAVWRSRLGVRQLLPQYEEGTWTFAIPPAEGRGAQGRTVRQRFQVRGTFTDYLFVGGRPVEVRARQPLDLGVSSASALNIEPPRGPETAYEVTAVVPDLDPTDLVGRGNYYPQSIARTYLQLPFPSLDDASGETAEQWQAATAASPGGGEWTGLYRLNERVVGQETDPYRLALAIQGYLRDGDFAYSLDLPQSSFTSPYAAFLFDTRTGYCQQFAGTMALLLRFNGVPARVAVGFTEGREERKGVYVVRRNDAHAWVEAYFPGTGWASFDPTPGRLLPDTADVSAGSGGSADAAGAGGSAGDGAGAAGDLGRGRIADPGGPGGGAAVQDGSAGPAPWLLAPLAVLAAWPLGRALLRRRGLLASSPDARVRAAVRLVYATLHDHGVQVPPSQTLDETARLLRDRYGVDAGETPARVQAVLFGGRTADEDDVAALLALRRRIAAAVRAREGHVAAIAALYGLRRQSEPAAPPRATLSRPA